VKKSLVLIIILTLFAVLPLESQGLLNKVKNAVSKEILGTSDSDGSKSGPEPTCACDNAKQIADLTRFKIDYREMAVSVKDDGSILVKDTRQNKYFIINNGSSSGPYQEEDPKVQAFDNRGESNNENTDSDGWAKLYPGYITKSGDKYLIKFNGKSYGPYAVISDFSVSLSKNKFAAVITEKVIATEDQQKKLEDEMAKAKTDQERMAVAMKFNQQMTDVLSADNAVEALQPTLVSNIPGATYDAIKYSGGHLDNKMKIDDILVKTEDKVINLQGNTVARLDRSAFLYKNIFINSSNNGYAGYDSGTLTFSNNNKLSDLFNPYLVESDGKVFLTYMYYSPGKNSIMQCAMAF
jgi:hypothetical protein